MSGCSNLTVEEIFSSLFSQERFYRQNYIPHYLQTFAPPRVQKLSRDVQTLALLQGASLLASVSPNPVPLFDLPPLPNELDAYKRKGSDIPFASSSSFPSKFSHNLGSSVRGPCGQERACADPTIAKAALSSSEKQSNDLNVNFQNIELKSDGSGIISAELSQSSQVNSQSALDSNSKIESTVTLDTGSFNTQRCQIQCNCPFEQHHDGNDSGVCDFYTQEGCSCTQAWDVSSDKNKCLEAVLPNVSKRVWTGADFDDARAAVRYSLEEDRLNITLSSPLRHLQHKTLLFPLDVKASVRSRLTHCYEVALYSKLCISALVERLPYLRPLMYEIMQCSESAAMLHDIGLPPVGRYGEIILRRWISEVCDLYDHELTKRQRGDLKAFNALSQGLRLVHSIYQLNLNLSLLAALIKCPYTYEELRQMGENEETARNKAGLFISELPLRERIRQSGLIQKRHPVTWIWEQVNDMVNTLGNLEDAFERGLLREDEVVVLIENLINYLKDNACNSTCDRCISACTCANGSGSYTMRHATSRVEIGNTSASNSDIAHSAKDGHNYGYGVDPSERDKLNLQGGVKGSSSSSCSKQDPNQTENNTAKVPYSGRQLSGSNRTKHFLGGEHDDVLADGLTFIKLDVILVDAIKHCYCSGKQDSFGVLQLVHGTNPISTKEMMHELGARTMLSILRECIVTYYIDDVVNAICAQQKEFFFQGELNVTHYGNDAHKAIDFLARFEQSAIYKHEEIEALELSGGNYLRFVLKEYGKLLSISSSEFQACLTKKKGDPEIQMLCRRIPRRCCEAYLELCRQDMNAERYARIRLILDFVSFMTDPYLASEYEVLSGNTCRHLH